MIPIPHRPTSRTSPRTSARTCSSWRPGSPRPLRRSGLPCEGINLFLADGEAAFQEVFHAHLHVFPRTRGDGFTIDSTAWSRPKPTRAELDANAEAIRAALG